MLSVGQYWVWIHFKHRLNCVAEEYIIATINLYLDIINLFIEILRILQHFQRSQ